MEFFKLEPLPGDVLYIFDSPVVGAEPIKYTIDRLEQTYNTEREMAHDTSIFFAGGGEIAVNDLVALKYTLLYGLLTRVIFNILIKGTPRECVGVVVDHGVVGAINPEARMKIAYYNAHIWNGQACYTPNTCWISRSDVVDAFSNS